MRWRQGSRQVLDDAPGKESLSRCSTSLARCGQWEVAPERRNLITQGVLAVERPNQKILSAAPLSGAGRRPRPHLVKGCGVAMESLAGAVLLPECGGCPIVAGLRQYSRTRGKNRQAGRSGISSYTLLGSRCTRNFQPCSSVAFAPKNRLKSRRLTRSFILRRGNPGKLLISPCPARRTFTRSHVPPMGLSGAVRHTDPSL